MLKVLMGLFSIGLVLNLNAGSYDYTTGGDQYSVDELRDQCTAKKLGDACQPYAKSLLKMRDENPNITAQEKRVLLIGAYTAVDAGCQRYTFPSENSCELKKTLFTNDDNKYDLDTIPKRIEFLEEACSYKAGYVCADLGHIYRDGIENNIAKDLKKAKNFYNLAAKYGVSNAYHYIDLLTVNAMPEGIQKKKKSLELSEISCSKRSSEACLLHGALIGESNPRQMIQYINKACELGNNKACSLSQNLIVAYAMRGIKLY